MNFISHKFGNLYFIVNFFFKKVFWNSDKQVYQRSQAEKIGNFFDYIEFEDIDKYHLWIKCFLLEFVKRWPKIDFLRLDKYVMLAQTIIKKYFDFNLLKNSHKHCLKIFDFIILAIKSGFYNFNFISSVLNVVGYFIDEFFKNSNFKNSTNNDFFISFTDKLIFVRI